MKRAWRVRRTVQQLPDGQHRWDRAYQLLLRWERDADIERMAHHATLGCPMQEVRDESSAVCTSVDAAAGAIPVD